MILDIGCGDMKRGDVNLDFDASVNPDILHDLNAGSLPLHDETFTKVFCLEVIEHVHNPFNLLSEIKRVLKPKGTAILTTPNAFLWRRIVRAFFGYECKVYPQHIAIFSIAELRNLIRYVGLEIAEIKYSDRLDSKLYDVNHYYLDKFIPLPKALRKRCIYMRLIK